MKGALFLLFQIESKTEAGGINPTLAELEQAPCNAISSRDKVSATFARSAALGIVVKQLSCLLKAIAAFCA